MSMMHLMDSKLFNFFVHVSYTMCIMNYPVYGVYIQFIQDGPFHILNGNTWTDLNIVILYMYIINGMYKCSCCLLL